MQRAFLLLLLGLALPATAADPTYWGDVRPALRKSCTVCHNRRALAEPEVSGGLTLDTYAAVLKWKGRPLLHPGRSKDSLLVQVMATEDTEKRMPLGAKPVPPETIDLFRKWIDAGAKEGVKPPEEGTVVARPPVRGRRLDVLLGTGLRAGVTLTLPVGPLAPVVALAYSPDGKYLAAGAYGRVTVWDASSGVPIQSLTAVLGAVNDLKFSPDGKFLAVAGGQPSARGDLRLFETAGWKLRQVLAGHDDVVASVAYRPDGKQLLTGSFDRTVRLWDAASGKLLRTWTHHSDFVHAVGWSPDGKSAFSASKDRSARMLEAGSGKSQFTFSDRDQDALALAVSPDGKSVLVSGLEPGLTWWSTETGAKVRSLAGHRLGVHEITWSPDGKRIASAGADGAVRLWDGGTGAAGPLLTTGSIAYAVALSPDGKSAACGAFDGLVRVLDTKTGALRCTLLTLPPRDQDPQWLAMTPGGYVAGSAELLATGRWATGGRPLSPGSTRALLAPQMVARALRGETVPDPVPGK